MKFGTMPRVWRLDWRKEEAGIKIGPALGWSGEGMMIGPPFLGGFGGEGTGCMPASLEGGEEEAGVVVVVSYTAAALEDFGRSREEMGMLTGAEATGVGPKEAVLVPASLEDFTCGEDVSGVMDGPISTSFEELGRCWGESGTVVELVSASLELDGESSMTRIGSKSSSSSSLEEGVRFCREEAWTTIGCTLASPEEWGMEDEGATMSQVPAALEGFGGGAGIFSLVSLVLSKGLRSRGSLTDRRNGPAWREEQNFKGGLASETMHRCHIDHVTLPRMLPS